MLNKINLSTKLNTPFSLENNNNNCNKNIPIFKENLKEINPKDSLNINEKIIALENNITDKKEKLLNLKAKLEQLTTTQKTNDNSKQTAKILVGGCSAVTGSAAAYYCISKGIGLASYGMTIAPVAMLIVSGAALIGGGIGLGIYSLNKYLKEKDKESNINTLQKNIQEIQTEISTLEIQKNQLLDYN